MIDVGYYSVNDIKNFFRFKIGDEIETTIWFKNEYQTLRYLIIDIRKNVYVVDRVSITSNRPDRLPYLKTGKFTIPKSVVLDYFRSI